MAEATGRGEVEGIGGELQRGRGNSLSVIRQEKFMTILNFVTQDELDNLNEEPRTAFMELVNHAQRKLSDQTSKFDPDNSYESSKRFNLEKSFMNVIVAAGKSFGIEPFSSMEIPRHQNFSDRDYEQFQSDLDHYVTQLVLANSMRAKGSSVDINLESKDKIRSYLHGLRDCVKKADMEPDKRKALLDRLEDFDRELEKRRVSFVSLAMLTISILGAPGAIGDSFTLAQSLVTKITTIFSEAKQLEDQTRQIGPQAAPKTLSPPRRTSDASNKTSWGAGPENNLDDEIPF